MAAGFSIRERNRCVDLPAFNVLSICAGVGGHDFGIHRAVRNARTVCYIECEISCCKILEARMRDGLLDDAPIWTDMRTFDGRPWRGIVDCIAGGWPCQPWSVAGKQKGRDDERDLWPEVARLIEEIEPAYFFGENVPGILDDLSARAIPDLRRLGYVVPRPILLTASEVGASQRRERLFLLAYKPSSRCSSSSEHDGREERGERLSRRGHLDGCDSPVELAIGPDDGRGGSDLGSAHGGARAPRDGSVVAEPASGSVGSVGEPGSRRGGQRKPRKRPGGGAAAGGADRTVAESARDGGDRCDGEAWSGRGVREAGRGVCPTCKGTGLVFERIDDKLPRQCHNCMFGVVGGGDISGRRTSGIVQGETRHIAPPSRNLLGAFPPGPGFGLDRVAESVLEALESGEDGADDRFLAELTCWARWQRILEVRPDLAPAISDEEAERFAAQAQCQDGRMADGSAGKLDLSRADKLRALGNGVVSRQCEIAFVILWQRLLDIVGA